MSNYTQFRTLRGQDAIDAETMKIMVESLCGCVGKVGPRHMNGYFRDGVFHNGGCASGSMWYDPTIKQMRGHPHCSCDGCF